MTTERIKEIQQTTGYPDSATSIIASLERSRTRSNRLEKPVMQKIADFTTSELMIKMNEILEEYPAQGNYAEDGRYTYPDRWSALLKYIKEKR